MLKNRNDFIAGVLFVAVGLLYAALSFGLTIGSALDMGPGFFPLVLCAVLVALGLAILGTSFFGAQEGAFGKVPWRALILLPLAIVVFGVGLGYLGLLPTVFVTALIATRASRDSPFATSIAISLGLATFCTLVFIYGVGLPIPVLGSWFVN